MTLWGETYETIKADSVLINGFGSEPGQYRVASVYHTLAMKFRTHPQRAKDKMALKELLGRLTEEC